MIFKFAYTYVMHVQAIFLVLPNRNLHFIYILHWEQEVNRSPQGLLVSLFNPFISLSLFSFNCAHLAADAREKFETQWDGKENWD